MEVKENKSKYIKELEDLKQELSGLDHDLDNLKATKQR